MCLLLSSVLRVITETIIKKENEESKNKKWNEDTKTKNNDDQSQDNEKNKNSYWKNLATYRAHFVSGAH